MTDYEKGLEKLGFIYDERLDLRRHPAFAWRVLCALWKRDIDLFDDWATTHQGNDLGDALYAAVEELGKGECNGQK